MGQLLKGLRLVLGERIVHVKPHSLHSYMFTLLTQYSGLADKTTA